MSDHVAELERLKLKYPGALYSYFRVANLKEQCQVFLDHPRKPPFFTYSTTLTKDLISQRLHDITTDMAQLDPANEAALAFLEWRLAETHVLQLFWRAYEVPQEISPQLHTEYRHKQIDLYGEPDILLFAGIIDFLEKLADKSQHPVESLKLLAEIRARLKEVPEHQLYMPAAQTFHYYKHLFEEAFPELNRMLHTIENGRNFSHAEINRIFEKALVAVGATESGWQVESADDGANIIVSKYRQRVIIPEHLAPRTAYRLRQIVAHEVGCHVQLALNRRTQNRYAGFDETDEGLAITLEQIMGGRFMYKRAMRYLAVCLAYGVDGGQRDFIKVYEILRRAFRIIGNPQKLAEERAFFETARVFRGGIPSEPGMAYIKDKIYLESNLYVWKALEDKLLSIDEFKQLLTGHDTILTRNIVP